MFARIGGAVAILSASPSFSESGCIGSVEAATASIMD